MRDLLVRNNCRYCVEGGLAGAGVAGEETATAVGSTAGAVRVAQHRALAKLRVLVQAEELY